MARFRVGRRGWRGHRGGTPMGLAGAGAALLVALGSTWAMDPEGTSIWLLRWGLILGGGAAVAGVTWLWLQRSKVDPARGEVPQAGPVPDPRPIVPGEVLVLHVALTPEARAAARRELEREAGGLARTAQAPASRIRVAARAILRQDASWIRAGGRLHPARGSLEETDAARRREEQDRFEGDFLRPEGPVRMSVITLVVASPGPLGIDPAATTSRRGLAAALRRIAETPGEERLDGEVIFAPPSDDLFLGATDADALFPAARPLA